MIISPLSRTSLTAQIARINLPLLLVLAVPAIAWADDTKPVATASSLDSTTVVPLRDQDGKIIPPAATDKEIEWGKKAAENIAKDPKIKILDPEKDDKSKALYAKLNAMAQRIGKSSARPLIQYKVTIIEEDTVNAFTLPNGAVYFYTGLLDKLASDDEIAAVMAHEIGHNACMHVLKGNKKAQKVSLIGLAAMLAALAGGANGANLAAFSQYAMIGVMSGYTIEYEKEADAAGVREMIKAGYNPSAMATVMKRFEVEEKRRPEFNAGIFQDHPDPAERVAAVQAQIKAAGLEFNPRAVKGGPEATVKVLDNSVQIQYQSSKLIEFAAGANPKATQSRAENSTKVLNELIRDNLELYQIKIVEYSLNGTQVVALTAKGEEIARVLPADAAFNNLSQHDCAASWKENIGRIFFIEAVNGTR